MSFKEKVVTEIEKILKLQIVLYIWANLVNFELQINEILLYILLKLPRSLPACSHGGQRTRVHQTCHVFGSGRDVKNSRLKSGGGVHPLEACAQQ